MDSKLLADFLEKNETFLIVFLMFLVIILLVTVIYLMYSVSKMKSRYRQMMTGVEGANLERMLIGHINEMKGVAEESKQIKQENKRLDKILHWDCTLQRICRYGQ